MTPEFSLASRRILVTGALGLIGREICDAFLSAGGELALTDRLPQEQLDAFAADLQEKHSDAKILAVQADLTRDDSVTELFARTADVGGADTLINLAALDAKFDAGAADVNPSRFEQYPLELWQKSLDVNSTGLIRVTQHACRQMLESGRGGNIINVASTYSLVAPNQSLYERPGQPTIYKPVDYVATKSMVPNFTRYLAAFYGREGIRANCIVPHGVYNDHPAEFRERFAQFSPLGRMCDKAELRGPFVFLASSASSYMTGSVLVVDGGWTAW